MAWYSWLSVLQSVLAVLGTQSHVNLRWMYYCPPLAGTLLVQVQYAGSNTGPRSENVPSGMLLGQLTALTHCHDSLH